MSSSLDIDGRRMDNIRDASSHTGYSCDYITKLAREEKIIAAQIGRQWYIDVESLQSYAEGMAVEQKVRQQQLSEARKRELFEREAKEAAKLGHHKSLSRRKHVVAALAVLTVGVLTGATLQAAGEYAFGAQSANAFLSRVFGFAPAAVATPLVTPVGAQVLEFSDEAVRFSTLENIDEGMLLLPDTATSSLDRAKFFSDRVKLMVDESGQTYVAKIDEAGRVVEQIPYVIVPVNTKSP